MITCLGTVEIKGFDLSPCELDQAIDLFSQYGSVWVPHLLVADTFNSILNLKNLGVSINTTNSPFRIFLNMHGKDLLLHDIDSAFDAGFDIGEHVPKDGWLLIERDTIFNTPLSSNPGKMVSGYIVKMERKKAGLPTGITSEMLANPNILMEKEILCECGYDKHQWAAGHADWCKKFKLGQWS